jgi:hypothetical protein
VVIRKSRGGIRSTFTVRKVSYGIGVERTFPIHSPRIDKIEVTTRGHVRRAKLYYLRGLSGKAARITAEKTPVGDKAAAPAAAGLVDAGDTAQARAPGLSFVPVRRRGRHAERARYSAGVSGAAVAGTTPTRFSFSRAALPARSRR